MKDFDKIDFVSLARLWMAILGALGLYHWNYQRHLLGTLQDISDIHFAFNSIRDLSIYALGSFVGALVLIGLFRSLVEHPEKYLTAIICRSFKKLKRASVYRQIITFRKPGANLVVTVVTTLVLYSSFTSTISNLVEVLAGLFLCFGLSISLGAFFFGDRRPYRHRFILKPNGFVFFNTIFILFLLTFVSVSLSADRATKVKSGPEVEVVSGSKTRRGIILGATATGIFLLNDYGSSFIPLSQISIIRIDDNSSLRNRGQKTNGEIKN